MYEINCEQVVLLVDSFTKIYLDKDFWSASRLRYMSKIAFDTSSVNVAYWENR